MHVGGVFGDVPSVEAMENHLVLTVDGLPSDGCPDGRWYVDVGLGDGPTDPLPLMPGRASLGPLTYGLRRLGADTVGDWCVDHDPLGSFPGMAFDDERVTLDRFAPRCAELQTSPSSTFVQTCVVIRREVDRIVVVRDLLWKRITATGIERRVYADADDWQTSLAEELLLPLPHLTGAARDAVWSAMSARHAARERARVEAANPT
jgi:N-hydroxyarylamine O-acetyltransferase